MPQCAQMRNMHRQLTIPKKASLKRKILGEGIPLRIIPEITAMVTTRPMRVKLVTVRMCRQEVQLPLMLQCLLNIVRMQDLSRGRMEKVWVKCPQTRI